MYADEAELATPYAVRRQLIEYGGRTPHGWPMWRLVRAGDCVILCQGRVHHFPRGVDYSIEHAERIRPTRISAGQSLMPRYRDIDREAWILQKWFPPKMWGTAIEWRQHRAEEVDTALFVQSFPENGDYFLLAGPWASIDEAGDITEAIALYLRREAAKPRDAENYIKCLMAREYAERERKLEQVAREIDRAETEMALTLKSVSADAQKVRDGIAAEAGIEGHLGASEAWG